MLWKSDYPELSIPTTLTTWQWAFESSKYSPISDFGISDRVGAYVDATTQERLDYVNVKRKATELHTALVRKYDFKTEDTVSIFASNNIWYAVALWATVRGGGRVNGASPAYNVEEMTYALKTAKTKFLFTLPGAINTATAAADQAGLPRDHIFLLEGHREGFLNMTQLVELGRMHAPEPAWTIPPWKTNREICGYLNFSSGTTGLPKAVMISHHNVIAQCHQLRQMQVLEPNERYNILAVMPLFHITGLVRFIHYPVFMNGDSIMLPSFQLETMLRTIITYQIRELILVPPIIIRIVRDPVVKPYLSDLRRIVRRWSSGSAPISPEVITLLSHLFPSAGFRQGYGATESTAAITAHPSTHYAYRYAATAGKLLPNTELKIVSLTDSSESLAVGQTGEICARGPQIAMGYLDNPAATAETFDAAEGWLRTGDVGFVDEEGLVHVEDRIKEMIKVKGQQVAPAELEDVLMGHEAVEDCAVVAIGDEYAGERPKAVVVVKKGVKGDEVLGAELLKWVKERKVRYKWLVEVEFADSVPKSPTGKLLRRVLKLRERDTSRRRGLSIRDPSVKARL